jgi:hypothetical protein
MSPRSRLKIAVGRWEPLSLAVALLVFVGLAVSGLVNVWIEAPDERALPGVALGSQTLLVVERGVAFFAAWLLVLVVSAQALRGRLPIEVSGRGVRYADAVSAQGVAADTEAALSVLRDDVADLRKAVFLSEEEREAQTTKTI